VVFPSASWDREDQYVVREYAQGFQPEDPDEIELEARIVREGVDYVKPHPSRVFWDSSHPLATINADTGVSYIGFWDVRRYGDLENNPDYFNRDKILFSERGSGYYSRYAAYFDLY